VTDWRDIAQVSKLDVRSDREQRERIDMTGNGDGFRKNVGIEADRVRSPTSTSYSSSLAY